jgi:F0F1-type ATP synthase membrane subunit c/vacuolar-type H+-ATPase subunit K
MDLASYTVLAKGIAILSMMMVPIGTGMVAKSVFDAIGRNPKLENTLFSKMIIAIALVETVAIFSLVAFFTL